VLFILIVFVVVGVSLTVLLWIATLFFQSYYYTEPTEGIVWQAPAAGFGLALFFVIWCALILGSDVTSPTDVPWDTLFRFNPKAEKYSEPAKEILLVKKGVKEPIVYQRKRIGQKGYKYIQAGTGKPWPSDPYAFESILIKEDGKTTPFNPIEAAEGVDYREFVDDEGWTMRVYPQSGPTGVPYIFRWSRFLGNMFLNFFHLVVWFLCLWLVLRFQWSHALGLAVVAWIAMTLAILPLILDQAARQAMPAPQSPSARAVPAQVDARMCMMSPSLTT
jgi:hypothetical protein